MVTGMKGDTPRIAIYMSCYNHEEFVGEAVESILGQTYENWELYAVNDGSTDKSGEILASYQDKRIHYYNFKKNTNLIGAIRFLMEIFKEADVDYIADLASDDVWEKDKLEKQIAFLQSHPEYKACFSWDKIVFNSEDKGVYENDSLYSHKENITRYEWLNYFYRCENCLNECSMLMEKDVFFEFGGKNQLYYQLGDLRLWYLLCTKYSFYLLEEELVQYRRHGANLSEPSPEVIIRCINERYLIDKEAFSLMDKSTFRRTFYMELPYMVCDTQEQFLAEQFCVFLGRNISSAYAKEQMAMDLYFMHSQNNAFLSVLENDYYFDAKNLLGLSGKEGLSTAMMPRDGANKLSPAVILINAVETGKIKEDTLHQFRYSTLFDLWEITVLLENGRQKFDRIKEFIVDLQNKRVKLQKEKKVLFLIAQSSPSDVTEKIREKQKNGAECYVAWIPSRQELLLANHDASLSFDCIEGAKMVSLCNMQEHCLTFMFELGIEIDSIYYVDCLDPAYESHAMGAGYSLAVEYHAILKKEACQTMLQSDQKTLAMMKSIEVYDEKDKK